MGGEPFDLAPFEDGSLQGVAEVGKVEDFAKGEDTCFISWEGNTPVSKCRFG